MRPTGIFELTSTIFFLSWYVTWILLAGLFFLAQRSILSLYTDNFYRLIFVNFFFGIFFVNFRIVYLVIHFLKNYLITIVSVTLIFIIFFGIGQFVGNELVSNTPSTSLVTQGINNFSESYSNIIFRIFGVPEDERMSQPEELMNAVNWYRAKKDSKSLANDPSLCNFADAKLKEFYTIHSEKEISDVSLYDGESKGYNKIGLIIELNSKPNIGINLVQLKWGRPLSSQNDMVVSPNWKYGCAVVSQYDISYAFGEK